MDILVYLIALLLIVLQIFGTS